MKIIKNKAKFSHFLKAFSIELKQHKIIYRCIIFFTGFDYTFLNKTTRNYKKKSTFINLSSSIFEKKVLFIN